MEITVNNISQKIEANTTLHDIAFFILGEKQKGIAIALNNKVIPKSEWQTTHLKLNDNLLIIKATQGG